MPVTMTETKKEMRFCSPVHRLVRRSGANVPRFGSPLRLLFCSEVEVYGNRLVNFPLTMFCPSCCLVTLPLTMFCPSCCLVTLPLTMFCPSCCLVNFPLTMFCPSCCLVTFPFPLVTLPLRLSYDFVPHAVLLLFLLTLVTLPLPLS